MDTPQRSYRGLIIAASIVGGLVLLGGLGATAVIAVSVIETLQEEPAEPVSADEAQPVAQPPLEPLMTGVESSGTATSPTICDDPCFSALDVSSVILSAKELKLRGLTETLAAWGGYDPSTVSAEYTYAAQNWAEANASPNECFFVFGATPVAVPFDSRPAPSADSIHYLGDYSDVDGYNTLSHSVRVFATTEAAEAHMTTVVEQIAGCPHYESGTGATYWAAEVTAAPSLELPASVAAVGWREDSDFSRYYVFDVQRGNLVIRLTALSSGYVTEEDARDLAMSEASRLSALTPRT